MNAPNYKRRRTARRTAGTLLALAVLAWGSPALCGEIHDAARKGDLARVQELVKGDPALVSSRDSHGNTPLYGAAEKGHKEVVEFLLANKADVDAENQQGHTPLHAAAAGDWTDVAKLLLANKANANARDEIGYTPLHMAALLGLKGFAELLLANKADVNARANKGWTPLHAAAAFGHLDVAELLVANGADVNAGDQDGWTPRHVAEFRKHKDVAEMLKQHGGREHGRPMARAAPTAVPDQGSAVDGGSEKAPPPQTDGFVSLVAFNKDDSHASDLRRAADGQKDASGTAASAQDSPAPLGEQADSQGSTPSATLRSGTTCYPEWRNEVSVKCMRQNFLTKGFYNVTPLLHLIDGKGANDFGKGKALHGAINTVAPGTFNSNWDAGFKVPITAGRHSLTVSFQQSVGTMTSSSGNLTVAFVAASGHSYVVDALVSSMIPAGWSPIVFDDTDKTEQLVPVWSCPEGGDPILVAAADGDLEKVAALVKENPELVSSKDPTATTALHWAVHNDRKAVAELLLANKADVNAKDSDGETPLHLAAFYGHKDVAGLLLAYNANIEARLTKGATPLHVAAGYGHKDVAELLLASGASVDAQIVDGETPLHMAVVTGQKDIVELLLANKANVNARTVEGVTPLHYAAGRGHLDVAESLLAHGADVNAVDNKRKTPLGYAKKVNKRVAELLRQHGGHE
jgi:ankyrin repeat protein